MGTYWIISQERLLVSGRTKRRWPAISMGFLLISGSSNSACSLGISIQFCDLLLLPLSITLFSGNFAPIKCSLGVI